MQFIQQGSGFYVGQDFSRAAEDMAIDLAPGEYAGPGGFIIGYIDGNPDSLLSFMRVARVRVRVLKNALIEA